MGQSHCHCKTEDPIVNGYVCAETPCSDRDEGKEVYFVTADALCRIIRREMDNIFNGWDTTKDFTLELKEIERVLKDFKAKKMVLSISNAKDVIRKLDQDGNHKISKVEFYKWVHGQCIFDRGNLFKFCPDSKERVWIDTITNRAFKSADVDGKGVIQPHEIMTYIEAVIKQFKSWDAGYDSEILKKRISTVDVNKDGVLGKTEFRKIIKELIVELYICAGRAQGIETYAEEDDKQISVDAGDRRKIISRTVQDVRRHAL